MRPLHILLAPIFMLAVLLIILPGCRKDKNKQVPDLVNKRWTLEYLQSTGTKVRTFFPSGEQKKISIVFTDSLNTVLFSGICNDGSGTYTFSASTGQISIKDLKLTLILCNNVIWENNTAQNLLNAQRFEINNDSLTIFSTAAFDLHFSRK